MPSSTQEDSRLGTYRNDAERQELLAALAQAGGNRTKAAKILGISRRALYYRLERHGLL
jgi:two-component system response regulator AtoC